MAITANKKFWTEFIDIYHYLPSLWNTKDENYNNRESRSVSWNKLVEKLQEVEPDANQDSVKRKINTFRSNFNREVRKIRQTQREHGGTEVYNPTLWYFNHLSFLLNQEKYNIHMDDHFESETTLMGHTLLKCENVQPNETTTMESVHHEGDFSGTSHINYVKADSNKFNRIGTMKIKLERPTITYQEDSLMEYTTLTNVENVLEADTSSQPKEIIIHSHVPTAMDINEINHLEDTEKPHQEFENQSTRKVIRSNLNKKTKLRFKSQKLFNRNHQSSRNVAISMDEAHIYGQSWSCGFRKLTAEQKLYAKKAIDEILILGQLNALKLDTVSIDTTLLETGGVVNGEHDFIKSLNKSS